MTFKTSQQKMAEIRNEWKMVGYKEVNVRCHMADKELLTSLGLVLMGTRMLDTLKYKDDDAMELAATLANKHAYRGAVTMIEVMRWHSKRPVPLTDEWEARYDEVVEALMEQDRATRAAENAKAHMESQGVSSEKYEEAAMATGSAAAWMYVANGKWRMLQDDVWFDVKGGEVVR